MALIDDEKDARRLARAIASDLLLYNDDAIVQGIENDDLFTRLEAEIAEGRSHFSGRVSVALQNQNLFDRALVDVVLRAKADVPSILW